MEGFNPQQAEGATKHGPFGPLHLGRQATSQQATAGQAVQNRHSAPQPMGKLQFQNINDSHEIDVNTPSSDLNASLTHKEPRQGTSALKLAKRMSIRAVDIANITRKEKQDLIDGKVFEFEANME
jgi:hypothetical protein